MQKHLEYLKKSAEKYDRVLKLKSRFPDLDAETDRWRTTRYKSKSVNGECKDYELRHTCGCCPDPGLMAMPYIDTDLGRVYSDPFWVEVGEGRIGSDYLREHPKWKEKYREAGISDDLIEKIHQRLTILVKRAEDCDDED